MVPRISAQPVGVRDLAAINTELLVVTVFQDATIAEVAVLNAITSGQTQPLYSRGEFMAKPHQVFLTPMSTPGWRTRRLALLGAGKRADYSMDRARRLSLTACLMAGQRGLSRVAILQPGVSESECESFYTGSWIQATAEGAVLAAFEPAPYKSGSADRSRVREVLLLTVRPDSAKDGCDSAVRRGVCLGECSNLARELTNEPANRLTPVTLAERALDIGAVPGLHVEILDEERIEALGMRLLVGVAAGSRHPPRVVVLEYTPAGTAVGPVLGLVGKGVTFDAGGLACKGHGAMENMKEDMAGGAAVICAMRAIALLKAPVCVVGVVPATENMPGPGALKPGDVLCAANGTTIEVLNPDAEGRLLLADGLWYACRRGATHLVDIATLTNACVSALGEFTTGLFGAPPTWLETVRRCADAAGDRCWPLPIFEEYSQQLHSDIADLSNSGGPAGGAITAAIFIRAFTGGLPWAHLDIAGTAWSYEARPGQPKGPTGVGVRTLAELALSANAWRTSCVFPIPAL